jgi:hypothetical protein
MADAIEGAVVNGRFEQTRRALLARAGLAGGAVGLASLSFPQLATAAPTNANQDPITVSDVTRFWGADNTGNTDARQAIQNCINESQGIAAVYFPPGTYKLVGTGQGLGQPLLSLPPKTRLIGHGAFSVLKAVAPSGGPPPPPAPTHIFDIQADDVYIENLTLDANTSVRLYGILTQGNPHERLVIRGVEVMNLIGNAIGIRLVARNSIVENCHVHHTQKDGLNIFGDNVVVRGNVVEDCGDDHIVAQGIGGGAPGIGGAGVSVVGNVVKANTTRYGCGIVAVGNPLGSRVSVVGNVVFGGVHAGIEVKGGIPGGGVSTDVVVSGNMVSEPGNSDGTSWGAQLSYGIPKGAGISIFSGSSSAPGSTSRVVISDNVIVSPRSCGVFLIEASTASSISDVRIEGNSIWMQPLAPSAIMNQSLYGNDSSVPIRRNGVGVVGDALDKPPVGPITDIRITDNDIRLATGAGIHARSGQCMRWDIRDNSVLDSWTSPPTPPANQPGILLEGVSSAMVIGNRAQDVRGTQCQDYGIQIVNPAGKYLVTDNDVSSNINTPGISPSHSDQSSHGPVLSIKDNLGDDLPY